MMVMDVLLRACCSCPAAGFLPTCSSSIRCEYLLATLRLHALFLVLVRVAGVEPVLQLPVDELGGNVGRRVEIAVPPRAERRVPQVLVRPDLIALLDVDGVVPAHTAVDRVEARHVDHDGV